MSDRHLVKKLSQATNALSSGPTAPSTPKAGVRRQKHISSFFSSELGETVLVKKLKSGGIFLKHGTQGFPHYRFVWCDDELKSICWGDLHRRKVHGRLLIQDLIRVSEGHETKTFKRAPKSCDAYRCLSLVTATRTLDLETVAEDERELWVLVFRYLIDNYQTEPPQQRDGNAGINSPAEESFDDGDGASSNRSSDNEGGDPQPQRNPSIKAHNKHISQGDGVIGSGHRNSGAEKAKGPLANVLGTGHRNSGSLGEHGLKKSPSTLSGSQPPDRSSRESIGGPPVPLGPGKSVMDMIVVMQERMELAETRCAQFQKEADQWKEDNRRLYLSHCKQVVKIHETIDLLTRQIRHLGAENDALKKHFTMTGSGSVSGDISPTTGAFLEDIGGRAASISVGGFPVAPNPNPNGNNGVGGGAIAPGVKK